MMNMDEPKAQLLQEKPQQQKKLRLTSLLLLSGGIIILGALLIVAWQVYAANNVSSNKTAQTGTKDASAPWDNYPTIYWQTLRTQVAQGLHLSEQQIESRVQSDFPATQTANGAKFNVSATAATQALSDLARAQGISQQQLHAIEVNAIQKAHAALVTQGVLTQQQASENNQTLIAMGQDSVSLHIITAFIANQTR